MVCRSQLLAEGCTSHGVPGSLVDIGDKPWVVQQCTAHMASDFITQQQLLQYGLELTGHYCQPTDISAAAQGTQGPGSLTLAFAS